ncbi:protein NDRG3-like isoform X2 [Mytilus edulis]|uniref:Protein NDRG3,Protein NDRG2,Protein NDRG1,Protein NDRG1-B,Protein NDRG4,Protein NDRG1-A n=1 Tax=Mytilus edulis TaxID=6550 RepID=A0A8S3Q9Q0_MYTED|nr:Protein NDRG3,Protein NDRG2,Protein NDRG1,Protein NDRG1-B,Protein NDRG4,Protein NDRG1-A [Mytilus edulis]
MEKLTDIELTSVQSQEPQHRMVNSNANSILIQEDDVETPYGNFHVAIQGDRSKMAILTFHDIGLNHITCFQGFFNFPDIQQILRHFCVYHVNAPGQEEGSMHLKPEHDVLGNPESLGNRFVYPSMEHLAEGIQHIVDHYSIKRFIGFGVGAGAYILSEYALEHPENVDSLVLINSTVGKAGWIEWGYQKLNSWYLWSGQMTNFTEDYLLWHWFGYKTKYENQDLVHVFREYVKSINPQNLSLFIESYLKRRDLGIVRELDPIKRPHVRTIKCRSILLVGDDSPHIDQVTDMNGRMDPQETDFMKIQDCGGMPLEEQPGKVCEAFRLFLQGMGYVPTLRAPKNPAQQTRISPHRKDVDFSKIQPVC